MNLKRRIKQIERKIFIPISPFCNCYGAEKLKYEVIPITLDEWKRRFDTGEETHERLPDFCEQCRNPVDKRFIEISFEEMMEMQNRRINEVIERMAKYAN